MQSETMGQGLYLLKVIFETNQAHKALGLAWLTWWEGLFFQGQPARGSHYGQGLRLSALGSQIHMQL